MRVAHQLRVSTKSAHQWRRGRAGLQTRWRGGCRLSAGQVARLRAALDGGPAAWGWDQDQRRTLARVTTLIARLSRLTTGSLAGGVSVCSLRHERRPGLRAE